ncbi:hypothetical protein VA249_45400 (plasmid) [Vibrio alfacsensis]|uniref:hypothetical protein n=1 Tax=Vibrio alfacsensis TaxID=1074311 RepID=UPI001BF00EFD|nr:hypothetical protein [Vibrio alfacsensis]BBM67894.1 hypothetical protein VA249_45400 [Vibrio alfacsensis]
MNNIQQTLTAILVCTFIIAMYRISDSAAQFVAMAIFVLVPVTIAFVIIRIVQFYFTRTTTVQVERSSRKTNEQVEMRIANARKANATSGSELMDIPAYARKAKGVHFPMTKDVLNGFVIANQN